jgi:hypothetical protein
VQGVHQDNAQMKCLKDKHLKASQSERNTRRGELVLSSKTQEVKCRVCQEGTRKSFKSHKRIKSLGRLSKFKNLRRDNTKFAHRAQVCIRAEG